MRNSVSRSGTSGTSLVPVIGSIFELSPVGFGKKITESMAGGLNRESKFLSSIANVDRRKLR